VGGLGEGRIDGGAHAEGGEIGFDEHSARVSAG